MAQFHKIHYYNIPPVVLPQKRRYFEKVAANDWQRQIPIEYLKTANALSCFDRYKSNLISILEPDKSRYAKELYDLALLTYNHRHEIDFLLKKFYILQNNHFTDVWIAKVLIAEMLWGKQDLLSNCNEVEAIRYYEEELRESFGEVIDLFRSPVNSKNISMPLPVYVRINLLSMTVERAILAFSVQGWQLQPLCNSYIQHLLQLGQLKGKMFMSDFHTPELFVFPPGTSFYNHPGYLTGKFLLQDKVSCLASRFLNPEPGSIVLDMFSAPGLKLNHLANIMGNSGLIYANDIHPERFTTMCKLMDMTKVKCVKPLEGHYKDIKDRNASYILVDPTSTYSGIFSKRPKTHQHVRITNNYTSLHKKLQYVMKKFHSARRIVYTTCSIFPEEGEKVVDDMLKEFGDSFYLLDLKRILQYEWVSDTFPDYYCSSKCLRSVPEVDLCQGYFIAVFERNFIVTPSLRNPVEKKEYTILESYSRNSAFKNEYYTSIYNRFLPFDYVISTKTSLQYTDNKLYYPRRPAYFI